MHTIHRAIVVAAFVLALVVLVPAAAMAANELPEAIEDPVAAAEPEIETTEPAVEGELGVEDAPPVESVQGVAEARVDAMPSGEAAATWSRTATGSTGSGSLPFTGSDSRLLILLLLVGSTCALGGVTLRGWARAHAELG